MQAINLVWQYRSAGERDWIRYLLDDFLVNEIVDGDYLHMPDRSIVVLSTNRSTPQDYIRRAAANKRCILYHISDESFGGRYHDYSAFNSVFRNYWSSGFDLPNIKTLPLGYFIDTASGEKMVRASERQYVWSFLGALKSSRHEMCNALKQIDPKVLHHGKEYDRSGYIDIMQSTIFCPCPMGVVNLETNRLYEALQAGCIPLVETRWGIRYYERLFSEFPLPTVRRWEDARRLIVEMLRDPNRLDALQEEVVDWWRNQKAKLKAEVGQIVGECFFSDAEPRKLDRVSRSFVRVPGWRQLELLRHQSPASAARRAKQEFKRLVTRNAK